MTNHLNKSFHSKKSDQAPLTSDFYIHRYFDLGYSCGQIISLQYGSPVTLQSQNYPSAYWDNIRCSWTVNALPGIVTLVQFVDFNLESGYDYLYVDGNRYTGTTLPADFRTSTSSINIRFTTDGSVTRRGFQITLRPGKLNK